MLLPTPRSLTYKPLAMRCCEVSDRKGAAFREPQKRLCAHAHSEKKRGNAGSMGSQVARHVECKGGACAWQCTDHSLDADSLALCAMVPCNLEKREIARFPGGKKSQPLRAVMNGPALSPISISMDKPSPVARSIDRYKKKTHARSDDTQCHRDLLLGNTPNDEDSPVARY